MQRVLTTQPPPALRTPGAEAKARPRLAHQPQLLLSTASLEELPHELTLCNNWVLHESGHAVKGRGRCAAAGTAAASGRRERPMCRCRPRQASSVRSRYCTEAARELPGVGRNT